MFQLPLKGLRWVFTRKCKSCGRRMTVESGSRGRWACPVHYYVGRPFMTRFEEFLHFD